MAKKKVKLKGRNGNAKVHEKSLSSLAAGFTFCTDKYVEKLEKFWQHVPNHLGQLIASLAMFILGLTVRGQLTIFHKKNYQNMHIYFLFKKYTQDKWLF